MLLNLQFFFHWQLKVILRGNIVKGEQKIMGIERIFTTQTFRNNAINFKLKHRFRNFLLSFSPEHRNLPNREKRRINETKKSGQAGKEMREV
jgi:hypothetical protein